MMCCTQNKFSIFFIGLSLLGRVGLDHKKVTHSNSGPSTAVLPEHQQPSTELVLDRVHVKIAQ